MNQLWCTVKWIDWLDELFGSIYLNFRIDAPHPILTLSYCYLLAPLLNYSVQQASGEIIPCSVQEPVFRNPEASKSYSFVWHTEQHRWRSSSQVVVTCSSWAWSGDIAVGMQMKDPHILVEVWKGYLLKIGSKRGFTSLRKIQKRRSQGV